MRTVEKRSMPERTDDGYKAESKRTSLRMVRTLYGLTKKEKENRRTGGKCIFLILYHPIHILFTINHSDCDLGRWST